MQRPITRPSRTLSAVNRGPGRWRWQSCRGAVFAGSGQAGLGVIERLDLALLSTEAPGRAPADRVQPDHVRSFSANVGRSSVRRFGSGAAGGRGWPRHPGTELSEMPASLAYRPAVQWGPRRAGPARSSPPPGKPSRPETAVSRVACLVPQQAGRTRRRRSGAARRQTAGRLTPTRLATSATASRSAESSTICPAGRAVAAVARSTSLRSLDPIVVVHDHRTQILPLPVPTLAQAVAHRILCLISAHYKLPKPLDVSLLNALR